MNTEEKPDSLDIEIPLEEQFPERLATLASADDFMKTIETRQLAGQPYRTPQKEAALLFYQWISGALHRPDLRGRVVKPMGTGKTGFAIIMSEMVDGKVLFVTDSKSNGEQVAQEYENHFGTQKTIGRYFGEHEETESDITISAFWMQEKWMKTIDWSTLHLIIIDEADVNGLSSKRAEFIKKIAQKYGIPIVGMSATEEQMSGRELKDVFPDAIYRLPMPGSLPLCRKLGLIPRTKFHDVYFDGTLEIDREMLRQKGDLEDHLVREFTRSNEWNRQIIEHYLRDGNRRQGLVIFRTNQQIDDFIAEARARGIRAMPFTGEISPDILPTIRNAFERGEVDLLVGSRLLGRGLNLPKIKVVYNSILSYSPQAFWQANGRALRNEEGEVSATRDVYAILPRRIVDTKAGGSVFMEEAPLCMAAFFSKTFFPDEVYLGEKRVSHLEDRTFDIDKLPVIRATSEVMGMIKGRRAKPEGFESRATQCARILSHLQETKMNMGMVRKLQRMRSATRVSVLKKLESLDRSSDEREKTEQRKDQINIFSDFSIELTLREEANLVHQMRKGIPLVRRKTSSGLVHQSQDALGKIDQETVKKAYHARDILLRAHLKLIAAFANMYVQEGHTFEELFQEGVVAFLKALRVIEPGRGRVMNYCIYGLYQHLERYTQYYKRQMHDESGEYSNFRDDQDQIWAPERELFGNEEKSPFDRAADGMLREDMKEFFKQIPKQMGEVLKMHYNIDDPFGEEYIHEKIGEILGVSRTRAWQIECKGLRWFRHEVRAKILRSYVGIFYQPRRKKRKPTLTWDRTWE